MTRWILLAIAAVAACGPGPARDIIPTLPADGDAQAEHSARGNVEAAGILVSARAGVRG